MFYFTEDVIIAPWFLYVVTYVIILVNFAFGSAFVYLLWSALINESPTLNKLHARCVLCRRKQSHKCTKKCCPRYMERRHARKLHREVERESIAAVRVKARRGSSLWSTSDEKIRVRRKERESRIKKNQKQKTGRTLSMAPVPLAAEFARRRTVIKKNKKADDKIKKRLSARQSIFASLGEHAVKKSHVNPMLSQHTTVKNKDVNHSEEVVDPPLPRNWATEYDDAEADYFFFNSITGETCWERPTVEQNNSTPRVDWNKLSQVVSKGTSTSNVLYGERSDGKEKSKKNSKKSRRKKKNKSFLQTVPQNNSIHEIEMQSISKKSVPQNDDSDTNESVKIDVDVVIDPLPPHWEIAYNEEGDPYYYNSDTGERTWERPMAVMGEDDVGDGGALEMDPGEDNTTLPQGVGMQKKSSRRSFRKLKTSEHGREYYEDMDANGQTTWSLPDGAEIVDVAGQEKVQQSQDQTENLTSSKRTSSFRRLSTSVGGREYYENVDKPGETTWSLPAGAKVEE